MIYCWYFIRGIKQFSQWFNSSMFYLILRKYYSTCYVLSRALFIHRLFPHFAFLFRRANKIKTCFYSTRRRRALLQMTGIRNIQFLFYRPINEKQSKMNDQIQAHPKAFSEDPTLDHFCHPITTPSDATKRQYSFIFYFPDHFDHNHSSWVRGALQTRYHNLDFFQYSQLFMTYMTPLIKFYAFWPLFILL